MRNNDDGSEKRRLNMIPRDDAKEDDRNSVGRSKYRKTFPNSTLEIGEDKQKIEAPGNQFLVRPIILMGCYKWPAK